ncbi:DUF2726 domain-containing protein [Micromonospora sp. NPDC049559]|uniref:DUF2726 domain-containing protein n=1 Tax=Micromonospora sp. NPDC049559 TaxID=3155923 RepID=UPI00341FA30C
MANSGNRGDSRLRPILTPDEHETRLARGDIFERGGYLVWPGCKLSQLVHRRPEGITAHQWSSAIRARFDFVVCDATDYTPSFVVGFDDPARRTAGDQRGDRMTNAVCEAVGLALVRIESTALTAAAQGRRIVEYLLDAVGYRNAGLLDPDEPAYPDELSPGGALGYRDIIGRLPDGRTGFVNDLGAVARAAAVDAYASRRLADPIIRGLHATWKNGPAEGWGWAEVRDGDCLFERVRIWQHRFSCGVDPARLAEDLAAAAIGERLMLLDLAEPELVPRQELSREFELLRQRRDEMETEFAFDHLIFE